MSVLQDYIDAIDQLVGGDLPLGEGEKVKAIQMALKRYSKDRPLVVVEDVDGDGGFDYDVADLASWSDGFSVIQTVEYPVDDDSPEPNRLQDDAWTIYQTPDGIFLRFIENTPSAAEDFRLVYTALHGFTGGEDSIDSTVKAFDEEAVQALAAAVFCELLASYYAQTADSTISADSVDHSSRAREYAARARAYRGLYFEHLGIKPGEVAADSVTADTDLTPSWQGDKLTHRRRYR